MPNFDLNYTPETSLTSVVLRSGAEDFYQHSVVVCFVLTCSVLHASTMKCIAVVQKMSTFRRSFNLLTL